MALGNGCVALKRRLKIVELARRSGEVRVNDLSERFGVSSVTVRSDLAYLEEQGMLIRRAGKAVAIETFVSKKAAVEILALNAQLEEHVRQRTAELEATLYNLRKTQEELIRAEKLAGLGSLVAGIAHEINTPLGSSVTVASAFQDKIHRFQELVEHGSLRRSAINDFLADLSTATGLLILSLNRAADLVGSFKRVAVDQTSDRRRFFDCRVVTDEVMSTLRPMTKHTSIVIDVAIPTGIVADSYPGAYGQVITNLTSNALIHAFDGQDHGTIRLTAQSQERPDGRWVTLCFSDDGCGIPPENRSRVFDPFFTTKLGRGGSGLGLHIAYTLVARLLCGRLTVKSEVGKGTTFTISFPLVAPQEAAASSSGSVPEYRDR